MGSKHTTRLCIKNQCIMLFLVFALFCAILPSTTLAVETNVAPGGLQTAVNQAEDGEILLLAAGSYEPVNIPSGKSITLQGPQSGTAEISVSSGNAVTINGPEAIYFKNIVIRNTAPTTDPYNPQCGVVVSSNISPKIYMENCVIYAAGYGINVKGCGGSSYLLNAVIELTNTKILNPTISNYEQDTKISSMSRGINLADIGTGSVLTMQSSEIKGFGYGINNTGGATYVDNGGFIINIYDSHIASWGCLNIWAVNTVYNIEGSTLLGINTSLGSSDGFSTIVLNNGIYNDDGSNPPSVFNISDSTITNYIPDLEAAKNVGMVQYLIRVESQGFTKFNLTNVLFKDETGLLESVITSKEANGIPGMTEEELAEYKYNNIVANNVTVEDPIGNITPLTPLIAPTAFTINTSQATLKVGETHSLTVAPVPVYADDSVTWASSDSTIATVNEDGVVTALKTGSVMITATAKTISGGVDAAIAQCAVTVEAVPIPVAMTLGGLPKNNTMVVGESMTLTPQNVADDSNTGSTGWEWNNTYFAATFNSPATFTAKAAGTTVITYTSSDGQKATATITITAAPVAAQTNTIPATGDSALVYFGLAAITLFVIYTLMKKQKSQL